MLRILAITNMYPTLQSPDSGVFIEQQIQGLRNAGVEVDVLFVDRLERGKFVYWGLAEKIRQRIYTSRPDLVHIMYGGIMADIATRIIHDRPTVVTFHGSDLLWEQLPGLIGKIRAAYAILSSYRAARRATGIVVVSPELMTRLPRNVPPGKVRIIPCGIDLARFRPIPQDKCREILGWPNNVFHVLFPSHKERLVKRSWLAEATIRLLNHQGIPSVLHFLQGVPNADVPLWLNACNALLLTSEHEGSPTVVKEALACNVPVVSVDVGDLRERIGAVKGCYLASADPANLAGMLRCVHTGPLRVSGRDRVAALSLDQVASQLQAFYAEICNGSCRTERVKAFSQQG